MEGEEPAAEPVLVLVMAMVAFVAEVDAGVISVESDAAVAELVAVTVGGVVTDAAVAVIMTAAVAVVDAVASVAGGEGWVPGVCHSGTLRGLLVDTCLASPSPQSWVPCQVEEDP